jgi:hypothetical protein
VARVVGVEVTRPLAQPRRLRLVEDAGAEGVADVRQPHEQVVGQIELAAGHGARQPEDRRHLVTRVLVELGATVGALGLRPPQVVHRLEQMRRRLVVGPRARPDVGRQIVARQRRGRQVLQGLDQPGARGQRVQRGRPATPDVLVDAHEQDVSPDP